MDSIDISFVIPVYKVEEFLDQCVISVISQDFGNLEVILVDDGSPDNCPKMCDNWATKDSRIQVIHKPNGGLSDARNVGLRTAKGKYVWFVDSDDWLKPNAAEIVKDIMLEYPDVDVYSSSLSFYFNGEYIKDDFSPKCSAPITGYDYVNSKYLTGAIQRFIIKRSLLIKNHIKFINGVIHEDGPFGYILMYFCQSVVFVSKSIYCYRQRENSIMHTLTIRSAYDLVIIHKQLMKFCDYYVSNDKKVWFKIVCRQILMASYGFVYHLFKTKEFEVFESENKDYIIQQARVLIPHCSYKGRVLLRLFVVSPKFTIRLLNSAAFKYFLSLR